MCACVLYLFSLSLSRQGHQRKSHTLVVCISLHRRLKALFLNLFACYIYLSMRFGPENYG